MVKRRKLPKERLATVHETKSTDTVPVHRSRRRMALKQDVHPSKEKLRVENLEVVDDQFNVDDLKKGRLEKKSTQTASTGGVNKR